MLMLVAHVVIGIGLGLSSAVAGLLLGHPVSTAFSLYVLAGCLGVIASSVAALLRSMRLHSGFH
jgi:hypothetical protein